MPSQDRVGRDDSRQFQLRIASDGVSLHDEQPTLVVIQEQSLFGELFEQGFDLSVLELDDLLLPLAHQAAEAGQQNVPGLEDERHVRRRKSSVSAADG